MSPATYTPFPGVSTQDADENEWWLRRELSLIENLLNEEGELDRSTIGEKLGCKYWGPLRALPLATPEPAAPLRAPPPRRARTVAAAHLRRRRRPTPREALGQQTGA